jgi:hypothetical protein
MTYDESLRMHSRHSHNDRVKSLNLTVIGSVGVVLTITRVGCPYILLIGCRSITIERIQDSMIDKRVFQA